MYERTRLRAGRVTRSLAAMPAWREQWGAAGVSTSAFIDDVLLAGLTFQEVSLGADRIDDSTPGERRFWRG